MSEQPKIMFLDDMGWRHSSFTRYTDRMDVKVWQAHHAKGAIALLDSVDFDQVFLDHDLSEDDILCEVGAKTTVPTGMAVVDHILQMQRPPPNVVIHSCNEPAAVEMERRLLQHPSGIRVTRCMFPHLIQVLEQQVRPTGA